MSYALVTDSAGRAPYLLLHDGQDLVGGDLTQVERLTGHEVVDDVRGACPSEFRKSTGHTAWLRTCRYPVYESNPFNKLHYVHE